MGKRSRYAGSSWWTDSTGGIVHWLLVAVVAIFAVGAAGLGTYVATTPTAAQTTTSREPAPIPTFSFGAAKPPFAMWLGDSFTEASQVSERERFPTIVSEHFGWNFDNAAEGGTGYITDGPAEFPEREPLTGHVQQAIDAAPDVLFVSGGLNDTSRDYAEDDLRVAVKTTLEGLRAGLPDTSIYVIGPFWPRGGAIPEARLMRDIVQQEAEALGLPFLDPIAGDWVNTDPALIGPDGTHPTSAGQAAIAQRVIDDLTALGVTPYAPGS